MTGGECMSFIDYLYFTIWYLLHRSSWMKAYETILIVWLVVECIAWYRNKLSAEKQQKTSIGTIISQEEVIVREPYIPLVFVRIFARKVKCYIATIEYKITDNAGKTKVYTAKSPHKSLIKYDIGKSIVVSYREGQANVINDEFGWENDFEKNKMIKREMLIRVIWLLILLFVTIFFKCPDNYYDIVYGNRFLG